MPDNLGPNQATGQGPIRALDMLICVTIFRSFAAQNKTEQIVSLRSLAPRLRDTSAPSKAALPWLKLAQFGEARTAKGSYRHDANVRAIHGIEADYDGEVMTLDRARQILAQANVAAVIYTSPSHKPDAPRWRVLCPTSTALPPEARAQLVARLNGLFLGALASESFTLSQSYYFGHTPEATDHTVLLVEGQFIDLLHDLDAGAVHRPKPPRPEPSYTPPTTSTHGGTPYGRRALDGECHAIRNAGEGQKHHTLNRAAYSIGGLVACGELDEGEALGALRAALFDIRDRCDDFRRAEQTLETSFADGKAAPRAKPAPLTLRADPFGLAAHTVRIKHRFDPETGEILEEPKPAPKQDDDALPLLNPADWTTPPPPRRWIVEGWIPVGVVSAKYGDGGIGKTLSAQQLMTSVAVGADWLGLPTAEGRTLGIFCEDDVDELHRRQIAINGAMGITMQDLGQMRLLSRLGEDNSLVHYDTAGNYLTAFHARVMDACKDWRPDLVVLDTAADLYPDNENDRSKVRWFIQAGLARIARDFACAVLLLAHPSVSGLASGSGTGGSTAWNNTVRSRIYLAKEEGEDADPNVRIMSKKKANYGAQGGDIRLAWQNGVLVPIGTASAAAPIPWETIREIFNEIERAWNSERPWSNAHQAKPGGRYLPAWIKHKFGIAEKAASKMVGAWLLSGCLSNESHNSHTKEKGLKVVRRPDQ